MSGEYEYQLPLLTGNPGYQPSDPGGDDRSQRSFSQASESDDQQPRSRGSNTWWNRPTRNHPQHPPSDAPPARDNPFSAKSRTSGSQSGHGQAQREAPGVLQIGNNKFNSLIEYLAKDYEGKATQPKCTSRGLHVIENDYGANEFRMLSDGTREPASPHSRANYQAWSRQASAKLESKPSESSSSPSGGSEQHQAPRRRRLDDEGSEGEAEQSQRYAAARQEKSKKDKKGDKHRRHHPKK